MGTLVYFRPLEQALSRAPLIASLAAAGWRAIEASNAEEVLGAVLSEPVDVIVLSAASRPNEGVGICRRLRQASAHSPRAVLVVGPSADGGAWRAEALAAGASACLAEPVDARLLLAQVGALIAPSRAPGPASSEEAASRRADEEARRVKDEAHQALSRSEARLQREQAFLRTVIDSLSSVVIVRDAHGRHLLANQAAARFHGISVGELEGKSIEELPSATTGAAEQDRAVMRDGVERTLELDARGADGLVHSFIVEKIPLQNDEGMCDRVLTTAVDITWRRRAERALRETNARAERMFSSNVVGMVICEFDGRVLEANDYFLRMLGLDRQAMASGAVRWDRVTPPEHAAADQKAMAELRALGVCTPYEKEYIRADGSRVWVLLADTLLPDGQRILAFVLDITERKRAEERLQQLNEQLAEADRRKDEFIAILSHELRNPVAPIRYALPLLHREALTASGEKALAVIHRQLDHLTRLVDDLLDVSRITRDKIELRRERVKLASVLTAAIEAATPAIVSSRHTLSVAIPDEPIWLDADAARIAQAVTNLLNNSAKYTPAGGEIALAATCADGQAIVSVRDNGMGIPPGALGTVFEMFRQVNRPERSQGGLGIGLALVKRLAELHGGSIDARSAGPGRGAEFVLRLPIAPPSASGREAGSPAVSWPGGRRLRVLIVDDNADLVEMLAIAVEGAGHDVRTALDGGSAVSAATDYRPDVVLLDLGLPVMTGLEVARELRRRPETAGVRIVALTGWGQAEDRRRTREAGFDYHLTKPTDPQTVERLLAEFANSPS